MKHHLYIICIKYSFGYFGLALLIEEHEGRIK